MKQRYWRRGLAAAALICALLATAWPAGATNLRFAHPAFQSVWTRTDQLVADHSVGRSWLWGPSPGLILREPYQGIDWSRALVELAEAIEEGRPHRASAEHAAHVVDALEAIEDGRHEVTSSFEPPAPLEWAL